MKSVKTAYVLWLPPLGLLGAHRFYAGRKWSGLTILVISSVCLTGIFSMLFISDAINSLGEDLVFIITLIALPSITTAMLVWWIADGVLVRDIVQEHNLNSYIHSDNNESTPRQAGVSPGRRDYGMRAKNEKVLFFLWLPPFGLLGLHRLYAGLKKSGVAMLAMAVVLVLSLIYFLNPPEIANPYSQEAVERSLGFLNLYSLFPVISVPVLLGISWLYDGVIVITSIKKPKSAQPEP